MKLIQHDYSASNQINTYSMERSIAHQNDPLIHELCGGIVKLTTYLEMLLSTS
jgi:hypothetical protein